MQGMLNDVAALAKRAVKQNVALQFGWHSKTEHFTVVAGAVDEGSAQRPVKAEDTFLWGSGTKPFTATAVMRLIEKGIVKADDRACKHINPYLKAQNGTTLEELFGPRVANATVLDLIRMSAGIPDYERGTRDRDILRGGNQAWSVYDNLWYAAAYEKQFGGQCESAEDCDCGHLHPGSGVICDKTGKQCIKTSWHVGCLNQPDGTVLDGGWVCWDSAAFNFCPSKNGSSGTVCAAGTCSSYSSTSFEVAGLLIAAVATPGRPYTDMDLGDFAFPKRERYPSLTFPPVTAPHQRDEKSQRISQHLTVPGNSVGMFGNQGSTIFDQHPGILGWTCGHMVGVAGDVARFFYDLFNPESPHAIVSSLSLSEMTNTKHLSGHAHRLSYGAGIMEMSRDNNRSHPHNLDNRSKWGWYMGHGGITYGFTANEGYSVAAGAGYGIATNIDSTMWSGLIWCLAEEIVSEHIDGQRAYLNCTSLLDPQAETQDGFNL